MKRRYYYTRYDVFSAASGCLRPPDNKQDWHIIYSCEKQIEPHIGPTLFVVWECWADDN